MRKRVLFVCAAVICLLALLCAGCNLEKEGRKIGNGTFETRKNDDGTVGLVVAAEGVAVIEAVDELRETDDKVYIVGRRGEQYRFYGLIDLQTNTLQVCVSAGETGNTVDPVELFPAALVDNGVVAVCRFSDFSEADRAVLNDLSQPE